MTVEKLNSWPAAFSRLGLKINEIVSAIRPISNIEGRNGVKVTVSENNILIELPGDDENDEKSILPKGYGPESWTVYVDGVVTTRNFITDKPD